MHQSLPVTPSTTTSVLILDDDIDALEEIYDILDLDGVEAFCVSDAQEAEHILIENPQITSVVTDVHLTRCGDAAANGLAFIARMRELIKDREITYIVQSGDPTVVVDSFEAGAVDFLTKPLVPQDLLRALRKGAEISEKGSVTEILLRRIEETTLSLQQASIELAIHDEGQVENREELERQNRAKQRIQNALAVGDIRPWFQPQVCLHTGEIVGFEALVRWIDPVTGIKSPEEFLPLAVEVGVMRELDIAVQRQAFDGLRRLRRHGINSCHVGINLTAGQLRSPDMVDALLQETARAGLAPKDIAIEILESAMLDEKDGALIIDNIQRAAELGFSIELDDFGTGHAALSSLRDVTVSQIKIDRSFVQNVHLKPRLQNFTSALVGLAKSLNVRVLAEGVECVEEIAWLKSVGCDAVQGYHIAKPMHLEDALTWAKAWDARTFFPRLSA